MAKATPAQVEEKEVVLPDHLKITTANFDSLPGDTFGGASEILPLDEEEIAGPLTYIGHRLQDLGNSMPPADMHEAKDSEGDTWRLPIATNFRRQAEASDLQKGDTFFVKRLADQVKKRGAGAGGKMQMYLLKITNRAPRTAAVTA